MFLLNVHDILLNNKMYFRVIFHAILYIKCPGDRNVTLSVEWLLYTVKNIFKISYHNISFVKSTL